MTSDPRDPKALLTGTTISVEELAEVLGLSPWSIYKAIRAGNPPAPIIRCGRRLRVPVAPLRRLLGLDVENEP